MTETLELPVEQSNELVLFADKQGLTPETKGNLIAQFKAFYDQADEWEAKAKTLVITSIDQKKEMQEARTARLALVKVRTGADKKREELKEDSKRYGNAVQGFYNILVHWLAPIEKHLEEQERFAERAEAARKETLKAERIAELTPFGIDPTFYDLGSMPDNAYAQLLDNSKLAHQARIDAECKAEEERIEAAKAEEQRRLKFELAEKRRTSLNIYTGYITLPTVLELSEMNDSDYHAILAEGKNNKADYEAKQEAIRVENERLKKEAEAREEAMAKERAALEAERLKIEAKAQKEREAQQAEARRIRAERDEEARKAQAERTRLENELQARKDAELKAKQEQEALAEAELSKGDSDKFNDLLNDLEALKSKHTFKSAKYKKLQLDMVDMLNKMINYGIGKQK